MRAHGVMPGEDPLDAADTPDASAAEVIVPLCAAGVDRDRQALRLQDPHADEFSRTGVSARERVLRTPVIAVQVH